ncbi:MAG: class IV adenylate cyclase [Candidatus Woesearchaeota archaeon]|nr:class IV adenylate cyclase [Candidatus Woesearchaeota archaeon]
MAAVNGREIEVKIKIDSIEDIKKKLRKLGGKESERIFEDAEYFDFEDDRIKKKDSVIRLRNGVLAFKGPARTSNMMDREEIEIKVDEKKMKEIFLKIGLKPRKVIQKYRTTFMFDNGKGEVVVDETPIGDYIEIEGTEEFIFSMTKKLGCTPKDHIVKTYGYLAREFYGAKGIKTDDGMRFLYAENKKP